MSERRLIQPVAEPKTKTKANSRKKKGELTVLFRK